MDTRITRWIKKWRARLKGWSKSKDRLYHNELFSHSHPNPFTWSYPGYITIRRFADLVSPFLNGLSYVVDIGCGCGEVTCELARRCPSIRFHGIDHSSRGIENARSYASKLHLDNVTFEVADVDTWQPLHSVDLIMLFNAFHHLTQPERFIKKMEKWTDRFVLIEPHGDWKGSHVKHFDFDWLMFELEKIRRRIAWTLSEKEIESYCGESSEMRALNEESDEAIEYRYTLKEFRQFFKNYYLEIRGTVAGIEKYPPLPFSRTRTREFFGKWLYELYRDIDEILFEQEIDLLAKHWVIYAEKGRPVEHKMHWPIPERGIVKGEHVSGPYDIEYETISCPRKLKRGERTMILVRIQNKGWMTWSSRSTPNPIYASYHWMDKKGRMIVYDGIRTPLPGDIAPGESCDVQIWIEAPARRGLYILVIDFVHEGITWFSEATGIYHSCSCWVW